MIAVEAVPLLPIMALIVVIFVRLGTGNAPGHQTLTPDVFKLPRGTGLAAVRFACTYGILSYGGFESSVSAGEESCQPTEAIPRSIVAATYGRGIAPWRSDRGALSDLSQSDSGSGLSLQPPSYLVGGGSCSGSRLRAAMPRLRRTVSEGLARS